MTSSAATLASLLDQMYQDQSVLQGWDAVMNLLESDVNTFLQKQWSDKTHGAASLDIQAIWCQGVQHLNNQTFTNVTQLEVGLGKPLFQFVGGQNEVTVSQDILSGTLKTGTLIVPESFDPTACGCSIDDDKVSWNAPQKIDTTNHPTIGGTVPLSMVQGLVSADAHSVVLDFSQGSFTITGLSVKGVSNETIVDQLKSWFATNDVKYVVASVDYGDLASQPALQPTSFKLNVEKTNGAGNLILQILITTNGRQPGSTNILVNEPIPTADGLTCSLMVSSRILYEAILVAGFNRNGDHFKLQAAPPAASDKAWSATIAPEMTFSGTFSFGDCCNRKTVSYSISLGGTYNGSPTSGFSLHQHEDGGQNVHVEITVSADYPVKLSGSGAGQVLTITPGTPTVTVTGSVEREVKSRLEGYLNTDLRASMAGISFTPITFFALKNLLFPGNLIKMSQAQVPGDLLIVGTFEATS